uniref:Uncharacterized protein n=1 Tax=Triticum urartu TaxID=4572 RepID=A0A8R7V4T4_TRIUA
MNETMRGLLQRAIGHDWFRWSRAPHRDPLHHALELPKVDAAVAVTVDVANHLAHGGEAAALGEAQLLEHLLQLGCRDEAVAVHVEHLERLLHLLLVPARAGLAVLGHVVQRAEERVTQLTVEALEVLEPKPRRALGDVRAHGGGQALAVGDEPERIQRLRQLVDRDLTVAVLVEQVEHPAEANRVEAAVTETERRRGRGTAIQRRLHHRRDALPRIH